VKAVASEFFFRFETAILPRRDIDDFCSIKIVDHIHLSGPWGRQSGRLDGEPAEWLAILTVSLSTPGCSIGGISRWVRVS
jgi:hypothetical protein